VGTWEVEWTQDDEKKTSKLVLYPDGSVSPPRHTEEQARPCPYVNGPINTSDTC
jgi:hypothetical protein